MSARENSFFSKDLPSEYKNVKGSFITKNDERFYHIENYDQIPSFFLTLTNPSNHWLFISSSGGLTAGRTNTEHALFPYYTVDRIIENSENTGSKTIIRLSSTDTYQLWEPFSDRYEGLYRIQRTLAKNISGSKLLFEEINHDMGLKFSILWTSSPRYGIVKQSNLSNISKHAQEVSIVDGIQNTLPGNISSDTQNKFSNLLDAYKRNEMDPASGLGIYALSAELVDKAEPSESLYATTWWQRGLTPGAILLSSRQLSGFRKGDQIRSETDIKGMRGAFFIHADLKLEPGQVNQWYFCGEVDQDHRKITKLKHFLSQDDEKVIHELEMDIDSAVESLKRILGRNDGLQMTGKEMSAVHHSANVMFNIMRGGYPVNLTMINRDSFLQYLNKINKVLPDYEMENLKKLPKSLSLQTLINSAATSENRDIKRIISEYLPLTFSRRHGDPSRPWNQFTIETINEDGTPKIGYEGNWRDIFQNWEAMLRSFPQFVLTIITRFLNSTSADGYNPYRINCEGVDWEKPDEDDPWSNIGYWSDHQIIYLQKLLEIAEDHFPGELINMMPRDLFVHIDIPYRIKPFEEILKDPKNTIEFDEQKNKKLEEYKDQIGADGYLLTYPDSAIVHSSMIEKLLILVLAKLVNFVPDGGIWMNTQRPEWNDANNALVGYGLSMVTLTYLERLVSFLAAILENSKEDYGVHQNIWELFSGIESILLQNSPSLESKFSNEERKKIVQQLGSEGSAYRQKLYENSFSKDIVNIESQRIVVFLKLVQKYMERSIKGNFRKDELFHSYNRLNITGNGAGIVPLYEMLEGQVAILSSPELDPKQAVRILKQMNESRLYREDQQSYLLYPNRELKGFLKKNSISVMELENYPSIKNADIQYLKGILEKDEEGISHFSPSFKNSSFMLETVELKKKAGIIISEELLNELLELYEATFNHKSFTGRSGTFFAYEGLGSIYWHMVSKLLLAVQERLVSSWKNGDIETTEDLKKAYRKIRSGLGYYKSPDSYGAFPYDPYSHTPMNAGAKQPGMTGQVKEEIITRLLELGIMIHDGAILFTAVLVDDDEYLRVPKDFIYYDIDETKKIMPLEEKSYGFTYCSVPVIATKGISRLTIHYRDGSERVSNHLCCTTDESHSLFTRQGNIVRIDVQFPIKTEGHISFSQLVSQH